MIPDQFSYDIERNGYVFNFSRVGMYPQPVKVGDMSTGTWKFVVSDKATAVAILSVTLSNNPDKPGGKILMMTPDQIKSIPKAGAYFHITQNDARKWSGEVFTW